MAFANQKSVLINDLHGNIFNFLWDQEKIILKYFNKKLKKYEISTFAEEVALEFDAMIDEKNNVYVVFQNKNGSVVLKHFDNNMWASQIIGGEKQQELFNLNIISVRQKINIIYCVASYESNEAYKVYHSYYEGDRWNILQLGDIKRNKILNPFQLIKHDEKLFMVFYNMVNYEEQICIKQFDFTEGQWGNDIKLTSGFTAKLFIDALMDPKNVLHLTYSEYHEGNLIVKYEKYKLQNSKAVKIMEANLSNPANCSCPTLIIDRSRLWNVWTEHDQIIGCFSDDKGLTWSNPYMWKASKGEDFFRHKFDTNNQSLKSYYEFNHSFGKGYPEYSLLGFGVLDEAQEMPLKVKKKDEFLENVEIIEDANDKVFDVKDNLGEEVGIQDLKDSIRKLEERIENIEEYIQRRRRGGLLAPKR